MDATLDLKLLRTFVVIANEGTLSHAADALHMSQPAVSRQLRNLERFVGRQLVVRSNKNVALTESGSLLYERAQTLLDLAANTVDELTPSDTVSGIIRIGAAESRAFSLVAQAAKNVQEAHPRVQISVHSGGGRRIADGMARGEFSFGLFIEPWDLSPYNSLQLPHVDEWGFLVPASSQLANKTQLSFGDLAETPLFVPESVMSPTGVSHWISSPIQPHIAGTYNLLFNASLMVREGLYAALCIKGILDQHFQSAEVAFVPLSPAVTSRLHVAWLPHTRLTPAESVFLEELKGMTAS